MAYSVSLMTQKERINFYLDSLEDVILSLKENFPHQMNADFASDRCAQARGYLLKLKREVDLDSGE